MKYYSENTVNSLQYVSGARVGDRNQHSEYYIIPLHSRGKINSFLCITAFNSFYLPPFVKDRIPLIATELEVFLSLLFSERDNKSQAIIVQTARLRVHPQQLKSERYLLDNFTISHSVHQPAFLIGDLVDSTPLNKTFGAAKVGQAMDFFLETLFEKNKHLGLIVSRRNGDEITIIVPNLESDTSPDDALKRLYMICKDIADGDLLLAAAKKFGILLPFQYKCVASQADSKLTNEDNLQAVPSFSLLTDSEIDVSSRVLSKIALRGECIFMERSGQKLTAYADILQLPKDRLRGVLHSQELYLITSNTRKIAA